MEIKNEMQTDIAALGEYFCELMGLNRELNGTNGYDLDIIPHTRSTNINAVNLEVKMKIRGGVDSDEIIGQSRCTIIVIEKATINSKTRDTFRRTCSIVMNDMTHEVIWDKMSRDSSKQAVEYCFGYMVNNIEVLRGNKPIKNIKEYVKRIVDTLAARKENQKLQERLDEVESQDTPSEVPQENVVGPYDVEDVLDKAVLEESGENE